VGALAAASLLAAAPAGAEMSGPCTATIGGENVAELSTGPTSTPVKVKKDDEVLVTMRSDRQMTHLTITLKVARASWEVEDKDVSTNRWTESIAVNDYATYGVGLYEVEGVGTGTGFSCTGTGLVEVEGSPFATVAGWVGVGLTVIGVAGLVGATRGAFRGTRGRLGTGLLGLLAGLVGATGIGVLLQQFSVLYPTSTLAIVVAGIGILVGLIVPWLARIVGRRRPVLT
jgi:hypothetical protein